MQLQKLHKYLFNLSRSGERLAMQLIESMPDSKVKCMCVCAYIHTQSKELSLQTSKDGILA